MKISIGADHRGFELKRAIIDHFVQYAWHDVGAHSLERTDYPVYAKEVCHDIQRGDSSCGILICGSGVGISIAANRFAGIYAALCWSTEIAERAKQHDGANVLVLPADFITHEQAFAMIDAWLGATFKEGRYKERLLMIDKM
jgi:ribose 5-phosphate isomerase B